MEETSAIYHLKHWFKDDKWVCQIPSEQWSATSPEFPCLTITVPLHSAYRRFYLMAESLVAFGFSPPPLSSSIPIALEIVRDDTHAFTGLITWSVLSYTLRPSPWNNKQNKTNRPILQPSFDTVSQGKSLRIPSFCAQKPELSPKTIHYGSSVEAII